LTTGNQFFITIQGFVFFGEGNPNAKKTRVYQDSSVDRHFYVFDLVSRFLHRAPENPRRAFST